MSLASLVPEIEVDPALLPSFLPWSLRYNVLYPYCELFSHIVPTRPGLPPWTAELEAYWETFDFAVWEILTQDHFQDHIAIMYLRERLSKLKSAQRTRESPDNASLADIEDAIQLLVARRRTRWDRLYGLADIRSRYLEHPVNDRIGVSDIDFLKSKLRDTAFPPPKAAPFSLWPIPLPSNLSINPQRDMLVCWGEAGVDWSMYALPDRPTLESEAKRRQFEPTAEESLEDAGETDEAGWANATMDDATVPLILSRSNVARSSGFIAALTGLFHRRHTQVA